LFFSSFSPHGPGPFFYSSLLQTREFLLCFWVLRNLSLNLLVQPVAGS
jgi:hypothetical protein